jgi:alpha-L-fucosidase
MPDQAWGVATLKPGRLFLHVFARPKDGGLFIPGFDADCQRVNLLGQSRQLIFAKTGTDLRITLPAVLPDERDTVVEVRFAGDLSDSWSNEPAIISRQFASFSVDAARTRTTGQTVLKSITSSQYFGNWKHDTCAQNQQTTADGVAFDVRFLEAGDYRVSLDYTCLAGSKNREGVVQVGDQTLPFETLQTTTEFDTHEPLVFFRHAIGMVSISSPGNVPVRIQPREAGPELFWLRRIVIEPVL